MTRILYRVYYYLSRNANDSEVLSVLPVLFEVDQNSSHESHDVLALEVRWTFFFQGWVEDRPAVVGPPDQAEARVCVEDAALPVEHFVCLVCKYKSIQCIWYNELHDGS